MVKKIVGLALAVFIMSGMIGIGTWAYFSDVETSQNVMAAGILDLKTNDNDGVSQALFATNMRPGVAVGPEIIFLKNAGNLNSSSLDIVFSYIENDGLKNPVNMTADQTASVIELITLNYAESSILGLVTDINVNGYRDIYDLVNADLSSQAGITGETTEEFEIVIKPRTTTSKQFQGDGITITINFTLNQ